MNFNAEQKKAFDQWLDRQIAKVPISRLSELVRIATDARSQGTIPDDALRKMVECVLGQERRSAEIVLLFFTKAAVSQIESFIASRNN